MKNKTMTTQSLLSQNYKSLGWSNQHTNNPAFWTRYHSLKWETYFSDQRGYSLEVCHETKEFLETDSSD